MKITFISNYLPFPPNNGVSLPIFHILQGLQEKHEVSYLYLEDGRHGYADDVLLERNTRLVNIEKITIARKGKLQRIVKELFQIEPYFYGYCLKNLRLSDNVKTSDVYIFSPFTILSLGHAGGLSQDAVKVALINDCTTAMMRSRLNYLHMKSIPMLKKVNLMVQYIRSFYMGNIESSILNEYDLVFVQTDVEVKWLRRISKGKLDEKTRIITNGVNKSLFKREIDTENINILFFGDMTGIYDEVVIWLLRNVWVELKKYIPDSKFHLIGKGASADVIEIVNNDSRIYYQSYVEEIEDVFSGIGVMLAPVFKDFGIINKVLESMAAGVPVVGDKTAFNGIAGFEDRRHAVMANTANDMIESAKLLLNDKKLYSSIAIEARRLMQEMFTWESRIDAINQYITEYQHQKNTKY